MDLVALKCPSCGANLTEQDIDHARSLAKCHHCKTLISLGARPAEPAPTKAGPRATVPLPEKFEVIESEQALTIRWKWWSPVFIFLLFFCIAWDGFLVFWYTMAFAGNTPWIFKLFPIVHLAVGVGLTYLTIAGFVNRTVISATPGTLRVWHGPLPWPGKLELRRDQIRQLFVKPCQRTHKGSVSTAHNVCILGHDGRQVCPIKNLADEQQALYLEQEIEHFLQIDDQPVGGELQRT